MRTLCVLLLAGAAVAPAVAVAAQGGVDGGRVTLSVRNTRLRQAVGLLCQGTSRKVAVEAAVPDVPVTLDLHGVAWDAALRLLVRAAATQAPGLYSAAEGDAVILRLRAAPPRVNLAEAMPPGPSRGPGAAEVSVRLDLTSVPFRTAARLLFAGTGRSFFVDRTVPDVVVNFSVRDVSLEEACRMLAAQAARQSSGITFDRLDDTYVFHTQPHQPGVQLKLEHGDVHMVAQNADTWIRIPMRYTDARVMMRAFFGDSARDVGFLVLPPVDWRRGNGGGVGGAIGMRRYNGQ